MPLGDYTDEKCGSEKGEIREREPGEYHGDCVMCPAVFTGRSVSFVLRVVCLLSGLVETTLKPPTKARDQPLLLVFFFCFVFFVFCFLFF